MKSDIAGQDDPMFTAKPLLNCASCAKGINNINGFRADNANWKAMPLRDPSSRMLKSGLGFSKLFDANQMGQMLTPCESTLERSPHGQSKRRVKKGKGKSASTTNVG